MGFPPFEILPVGSWFLQNRLPLYRPDLHIVASLPNI